jgi:hypothetical protein
MRRTLAIVILWLTGAAHAADWKMPEFLISFWGGPQDDATAQAIVQASFNTVMCKPDKLELCRKHGLKTLLFDATPELAARLRDDASVWGYCLQDEPGDERFPALAKAVAAFREADPNHPAYINLGWKPCPRTFVETVRPQVLSYDEYWWWWKGDYFPMLEEFRDVSRSAGIPLLCWVEANTGPDSEVGKGLIHPPDNPQKLRYSVYCALAYGVKGLQWFVDRLIFDGAKLTPSGNDVAAINAELKRLGPVLMGLRSLDVYHCSTEPVPKNTRMLPHHHWIQTATPETLLGTFKDAEGTDYVMVVNRKVDKDQPAVVRFARAITNVERFDKQKGLWTKLDLVNAEQFDKREEWAKLFALRRRGRLAVELTLSAGDGELLRIR